MFGAVLLLASCDYCDYGDGDRIHSSCGASWWGGTGVVCDHHGDCFCWLECADDYSEQSVTTDPWAMDCVFVDSGGGNSGFSDYAASASVNMMKRFSQQDWLDAGLSALSEGGVGAVTIDALCRRVGKTKGSFYSHFPTMSDFIRQLGERWRQTNTDMLIDASERAKPEERRAVLNQLAMSLDHGLQREFRRLAAGDHVAAEVLHDVDDRRIEFLAESYRATGVFNDDDALALARVEYAMFLGYQNHMEHRHDEFADSYQRFLRIIGV